MHERWDELALEHLELASERLALRPARPDDAAVIARAMQDASLQRYLPVPDPYRESDALDWVAQTGSARAEHRSLETVLVTVDGTLVGSAGVFFPCGRAAAAEVGYSIYPWGRGHGYAAEAAARLTGWAIEHGFARVELFTEVSNSYSQRVALDAGFRYEGVLRSRLGARGSAPSDGVLFARTQDDPPGPIEPRLAPLPRDGLTDGVITLRPMAEQDVEVAYAEAADPEARRWAFSADPPARADLAAMTARAPLDWLVGDHARMVIVDVASGAGAGTLGLHHSGPPQVGLIGYGVLPAFRGRGYTARALHLFAPWAFAHGIARLELGAAAANIASQRAAIRGGFEPDGIRAGRLRLPDGTFSDEVCFALTPPQTARRISP